MSQMEILGRVKLRALAARGWTIRNFARDNQEFAEVLGADGEVVALSRPHPFGDKAGAMLDAFGFAFDTMGGFCRRGFVLEAATSSGVHHVSVLNRDRAFVCSYGGKGQLADVKRAAVEFALAL